MNKNDSIQTKNAFFFSHDSNARNDDKIVRLRMRYGAEGYGIYFMLVEMLMESSDYELPMDVEMLAYTLRADKEMVVQVIQEFELFEITADGQRFFSQSLLRRVEPLENQREQRRQAGIRSGEARRKQAEKNIQKAESQLADNVDNRTAVERKRTSVQENVNDRCQKMNIESRVEQKEEKRVEQNRGIVKNAKNTVQIFVPPTPQEVEAYCKERKNKVDAHRFCTFYQSKGWMVGSSKMSNWRASVRMWEEEKPPEWKRRQGTNITNHDNEMRSEKF